MEPVNAPTWDRFGLARVLQTAWLPPALVAGSAVFLWLVFYPGLLSYDSITQYRQAVLGEFNNAHPPVMSICMAGVLRVGGDIQHLMLAQCLAGLLGVYALAVVTLRSVFGDRIGPAAARFTALAVVSVLLAPVSSLAHQLMTFWKDIWLLVCFCWLAVFWLHFRRPDVRGRGPAYALGLAAFLGLTTLAVLVRHNSVVVLPVLSLMFALLVRRRAGWKCAAPLMLLPGFLYFGSKYLLEKTFHVANVPLENSLLVFDLDGLCYYYPDMRDELPYTGANLGPDFRERYYDGYFCLYGLPNKPEIYDDPARLRQDYLYAALHYPLRLARVKYKHFHCYFVKNASEPFHSGVDENEFGLRLTPRFAALRGRLTGTLWWAFHNPHYRWVFLQHTPWFFANFLLLGLNGLLWLRRRQPLFLSWLLLLLLPLSYYGSFYLATCAADFRYMYPCALLLQTTTLAVLCGGFVVGARRGWRLLRRGGRMIPAANPSCGSSDPRL